MSKKSIFAILVAVCAAFVALEFLIASPLTGKLDNKSNLAEQNNSNNSEFTVEKEPTPFLNNVEIDNFIDAGIENVQIKDLKNEDYIFKAVAINSDEDGFSACSASFVENNNLLLKITEFHAEKEITTANVFNTIKAKFYQFVGEEDNSDKNINQTNAFGEHSFYYNNNKEYPDMVFLVVKGEDKVMAFEYKKEDNDKIIPVINNIFQKKD